MILASASPRRRQLLQQVRLPFVVIPSKVDETSVVQADPARLVCELASLKAHDVATSNPDALVLGADTTVVMSGAIVGKPLSADEARAILRRHSGSSHEVFTGIALVHHATAREAQTVVRTEVTFAELSEAEIESYVRDGSPMDKAGAYGYQDALGPFFVESIRGDYYNVIGLPLRALYRCIRDEFRDMIEFDGRSNPPMGARTNSR